MWETHEVKSISQPFHLFYVLFLMFMGLKGGMNVVTLFFEIQPRFEPSAILAWVLLFCLLGRCLLQFSTGWFLFLVQKRGYRLFLGYHVYLVLEQLVLFLIGIAIYTQSFFLLEKGQLIGLIILIIGAILWSLRFVLIVLIWRYYVQRKDIFIGESFEAHDARKKIRPVIRFAHPSLERLTKED